MGTRAPRSVPAVMLKCHARVRGRVMRADLGVLSVPLRLCRCNTVN